jgi:hypothetical protein
MHSFLFKLFFHSLGHTCMLMYRSVIYVTAMRHNSLKQNKTYTYIEYACSSYASLIVWKVSVSAMKLCNNPQKYLIFYIAAYSEHMHNSDKLVSHSVVYFLMMTEHFNQVGILLKTNCLRTARAPQSFSKIHIPYFVFLLMFRLSLQ